MRNNLRMLMLLDGFVGIVTKVDVEMGRNLVLETDISLYEDELRRTGKIHEDQDRKLSMADKWG